MAASKVLSNRKTDRDSNLFQWGCLTVLVRQPLVFYCFKFLAMVFSTSGMTMGLDRWAFMPDWRQASTSSAKALAVMAMMGMDCPSGRLDRARMARVVWSLPYSWRVHIITPINNNLPVTSYRNSPPGG